MQHKANQLAALNNAGAFRLPVSSVDGRTFISNGRRFVDFCSCNYLGYEFDPHVHATAMAYAEAWGCLSGWSRMEADSQIYLDLEQRICNWLQAPSALLGLSVTMNGFSLMPGIAKKGIIFADSLLHTVVWEAARLARDHGAQLVKFRHQDMADLERLLRAHADTFPKVIAVDGVYSVSTEAAPIRALQELCARYDAWLYIDDAHGFGVLGEQPTAANPYGKGGKGIVAHAGGNYDRTFYVTSFGKAFCAQNAFTVVPRLYPEDLRAVSTQYLFSGPPPPHIIGATHAVLDLDAQRGEKARAHIRTLVDRMVDGMRQLGLVVVNTGKHPVVFLEAGTLSQLLQLSERFQETGILAGLRAYPVVPADRCGMRFTVTALNSAEQIDHVLNVLSEPTLRRQLRSTADVPAVAVAAQGRPQP